MMLKKGKDRKQSKLKAKKQERDSAHEDHTQSAFRHNQQNKILSRDALGQMSVAQQTKTIHDLAEKLLLEPEKNVRHLQTILGLIKSDSVLVSELAIDTLSTVFIQIVPMSVELEDQQQEADNKNGKKNVKPHQRQKKEEHEISSFEASLVGFYKKYLDTLKQLSRSIQKNQFPEEQVYKRYKNVIVTSGVKCFTNLWNFNHSNELIDGLFRRHIRNESVRMMLQDFLTDKNPSLMKVKVSLVKMVTKLVVEKHENELPEDIVRILNRTQIDSKYLKKDSDSEKYKQKRDKKQYYKEKELQKKKDKEKDPLELKRERKLARKQLKDKVREEVDKEFDEGELQVKAKQLMKYNGDILQDLYYLYFKIMLRRTSCSIFLKDCLDGILKFAHLISTDLIKALIQNLSSSAEAFRELWKNSTADPVLMEARLHIVFTAESVINGPGTVFNMDDVKQATHLYKIFRDLNSIGTMGTQKKSDKKQLKKSKSQNSNSNNVQGPKDKKKILTGEVLRMLVKGIEEMFIKKRQLSDKVVASFVREIALLMVNYLHVPRTTLLELIRLLTNKYPKILRMFEEDNEGYGLNSFNPAVDDPHSSNALYTTLLEPLNEIARHIKKSNSPVAGELDMVNRLLKQNFNNQKIVMLGELLKKDVQLIKE